MKKSKIFLLLVIFLGMEGLAEAFTDITLAGELDIATTLYQFPTRDQGRVDFSIPSLKLKAQVPLQEDNQFSVELESAENRDGASKLYDTQVKEAYLSLASFLPEGAKIRYGLIPDFWTERGKEQWTYDFWGAGSDVLLLRYNYLSSSDLGLMYQARLADEWGVWALSVTNGEGETSDETGAHKQYQLVLRLSKAAPFHFMLGYVRGTYEKFDEKINEKTRLLAHVSYEADESLVALEYFESKDPADVISNGVDLSAQMGSSVSGRGASLLGRHQVAEGWSLFLRTDWLNPLKENSKVSLMSFMGGASYEMSEDILWAFSYESVQYGDSFSVSPRDEGRFVAATRVSF